MNWQSIRQLLVCICIVYSGTFNFAIWAIAHFLDIRWRTFLLKRRFLWTRFFLFNLWNITRITNIWTTKIWTIFNHTLPVSDLVKLVLKYFILIVKLDEADTPLWTILRILYIIIVTRFFLIFLLFSQRTTLITYWCYICLRSGLRINTLFHFFNRFIRLPVNNIYG